MIPMCKRERQLSHLNESFWQTICSAHIDIYGSFHFVFERCTNHKIYAENEKTISLNKQKHFLSVFPLTLLQDIKNAIILSQFTGSSRKNVRPRNQIYKTVYVCISFSLHWLEEQKLLQLRNALSNLVSFAEFKQREKHPWMSATFSKVTFSKSLSLQLYYT